MKILVTGSSGLVGTALVEELKQVGHTVLRLVRPGSIRSSSVTEGFDVEWNPVTGGLGGAAVGADAVVNLAGASITGGRWNEERKKILRTSRVDATDSLVNSLARMAVRPRVLVCASAIGYYGNRGDQLLTEESAAGAGFLPDLARDWEASARKAEAIGVRVVCARFGIILAKQGGALPQMVRLFKLGVGGKLGSGRQWMSWVTLTDTVHVVRLAVENAAVRGAINVVSPEPVRNVELTKALATALYRPAIFAVPEFALKLAMGEAAGELLLSSQRVLPAQLEKLGYKFTHSELGSALRATV
ncbi:MAG TPA: TIGR01777 family oxidoreductase [Candidatus Acidoferrum sp.]|nr:TIGR01777 family oxidoreductase [Candidatus Acidoferrum sp.]